MRTARVATPARAALVVVLVLAVWVGSGPALAGAPRFLDRTVRVDGSTYLVGRVAPDGADRFVYYQRKRCATCRWKPYAKQRADDAGRFRVRIDFPRTNGPTWRYRGYAPATATQPRSQGPVWLACARASCRP